jgi:hypothetical protein
MPPPSTPPPSEPSPEDAEADALWSDVQAIEGLSDDDIAAERERLGRARPCCAPDLGAQLCERERTAARDGRAASAQNRRAARQGDRS